MSSSNPLNKKLSVIYNDPADSGSLGGVERLWLSARKRHGLKKLKRRQVEEFLKTEEPYTLHKQIRRRFRRNPVIVSGIDDQWQADLAEMGDLAKENDGNRYILTVIDCLSKYAWAIPVQSKDSKAMVDAFRQIFYQAAPRKPTKLHTDKGKEFLNREVQNYLKAQGVKHFVTENETKASIVERFNRTLKSRLFRHFTSTGDNKYLNVLPQILESYNASKHRSIGVAPSQVNKSNESKIWHRLYGSYAAEVRGSVAAHQGKRKSSSIGSDSTVRMSKYKTIFDKGYLPNWTGEQFRIASIESHSKRPLYKVKDYDDDTIAGRFYPEELQVITDTGEYEVEKVLKRRKAKGESQVLVKWKGWPDKFNSWIPESNLSHTE